MPPPPHAIVFCTLITITFLIREHNFHFVLITEVEVKLTPETLLPKFSCSAKFYYKTSYVLGRKNNKYI